MEDDPDEARRSRDALADSGYLVQTAASLQAATRVLTKDAQYDLVFVDLNLPDGDGLRLIPQLRGAGIQAPVVLLTGNRSERVNEQAFRAGCADLALKEINYHLWLPSMAQALIAADEDGDGERRWGSHVIGLCAGRLQGQNVQAEPADLWAPLAGALQAATDLAVRGVRATGQSLLGSLPIVHLQLQRERHLLLVLRGGVFAAALLSRPPQAADTAELLAEAAGFGRARSGADDGIL